MEARIWNYKTYIKETNPEILKNMFNKKLTECEFNILNFMDYYFKPFGYSGLWLLAESHFALHTFPEQEKTYIELSSCNKKKYVKFIADFVV